MFLAFIATLTLATAPFSENVHSKELQTVQSYHLDSQEGQMTFLEEKLTPFIMEIEQLNNEIQTLSKALSELDESRGEEILDLYNQLGAKMEIMSKNLPILENIIHLESDLEQIEEILEKASPLTTSEEDVLKRLATLCDTLDALHPQ